MLSWLVIGGGIHGTHLSLVLTERCGVPRHEVRVLDAHERPLERWLACTRNTGMSHLRSPAVHHLDLDPFSLRQFAAAGAGRAWRSFAPPYDRPGRELFEQHCAHVIAKYRLDALRVRGRAQDLRVHCDRVVVETDAGVLTARQVLLAPGVSEQPHWPEWARQCKTGTPAAVERICRIFHVFEPGFATSALAPWSHLIVIGGGISAAQLATHLARKQPGTVTLLSRHELRVHQFDSEPGWLGPRFLAGFASERDPGRRRAQIQAARWRGSMPRDVHRKLLGQVRRGALRVERGEVIACAAQEQGLTLSLRDGTTRACDRVILATGFAPGRPGGAWLDRLITEHELACAACGFPLVDSALRWHPRIAVAGPLAELELGPAARNIAGARHAGERLARAA